MVRVDLVDAAVYQIAARTFRAPVMVTTVKPGYNYEAELEEIQQEREDLPKQRLPWDVEDAKRAELRARYDDLSSRETVPDEVVTEPSGQTYWQLWDALTDAQRGPWLRTHGFRCYADKTMVKLVRDTPGPWDESYMSIEDLLPPKDMTVGSGRVVPGVRLSPSA
jgi:hypothetical protein